MSSILIYTLMILACAGVAWLYDERARWMSGGTAKKRLLGSLFMVASIPAVLISAIRFNVGTDYNVVYWHGFLRTIGTNETGILSRSFVDICHFLQLFTKSPVIFFVFSSCVIYPLIFLYIKRTEPRIFLPVILFFVSGLFFDSLNAVRQYMAIAVWLCGFPFIQEKKPLPYLLFSALAAYLHSTALLLLPMYVLYHIQLKRKWFVILLGCAVVGNPLLRQIMLFIMAHTRYSYYFNSANFVVDPELAGTVYALLFTVVAFVLYQRIEKAEAGNYYLWSLLIYDAAIFMSYFFPQMGRVATYFKFQLFINFIPLLLGMLPEKKRRFYTVAVVCFLILATLFMKFYLGHSNVFPYQTIFSAGIEE